MSEHRVDWLGQYLDGELQGERLKRAESHLAGCAACRDQVEELRRLSALLREVPEAQTDLSPTSFVSRVVGQLNGRKNVSLPQRLLTVGWRLAPVALVGVLFFVQALMIVAPLALLVVQTGVGGELLADVLPATGDSWLKVLSDLSDAGLGNLGAVFEGLVAAAIDIGVGLALMVVPIIFLALLFNAWLLVWLNKDRSDAVPATPA